MQNTYKRFGNPSVILLIGLLFLINLVMFSIPSLAGSQPRILGSAPELTIPDMKGIYSPDYVNDFLTAIGPTGRYAYQIMHFTTDLIFPFVYGMLLFAGLCRLVGRLGGQAINLPLIALVPVAADLAENFTLVSLTANYPAFLSGLARLAQVFSLLKFGGIAFCLVVMVFLLGRRKKVTV